MMISNKVRITRENVMYTRKRRVRLTKDFVFVFLFFVFVGNVVDVSYIYMYRVQYSHVQHSSNIFFECRRKLERKIVSEGP